MMQLDPKDGASSQLGNEFLRNGGIASHAKQKVKRTGRLARVSVRLKKTLARFSAHAQEPLNNI